LRLVTRVVRGLTPTAISVSPYGADGVFGSWAALGLHVWQGPSLAEWVLGRVGWALYGMVVVRGLTPTATDVWLWLVTRVVRGLTPTAISVSPYGADGVFGSWAALGLRVWPGPSLAEWVLGRVGWALYGLMVVRGLTPTAISVSPYGADGVFGSWAALGLDVWPGPSLAEWVLGRVGWALYGLMVVRGLTPTAISVSPYGAHGVFGSWAALGLRVWPGPSLAEWVLGRVGWALYGLMVVRGLTPTATDVWLWLGTRVVRGLTPTAISVSPYGAHGVFGSWTALGLHVWPGPSLAEWVLGRVGWALYGLMVVRGLTPKAISVSPYGADGVFGSWAALGLHVWPGPSLAEWVLHSTIVTAADLWP